MRAFLAVEFPETVRAGYAAARVGWAARFPSYRWVRPDTLHLTLRFLGEVEERLAENLRAPVARAAAVRRAARFGIGAPCGFGPARAPRVLCFGVDAAAAPLMALRADIEKIVRSLDLPADNHRWSPHVTVARTRGRRVDRCRQSSRSEGGPSGDVLSSWSAEAAGTPLVGASIEWTEVTLLASQLTPEGPRYTAVWRAPLGAS